MAPDLERGQRVYDWWGTHGRAYRAVDAALYLGRRDELRRRAVGALDRRGGETVLDLACGPGVNFALLESAIGPSGKLLGLDYSPEMLAAGKERVRDAGWRNVELLQDDAAHASLAPESLDAAICTLGLSVIPQRQAAIARVLAALRRGGRFVVLDGQLFRGPARVLNPVMKPLLGYISNWDPEADLAAELRDRLAEIEVEEFNAGSLFIAVGRTPAARRQRDQGHRI